MSELVAAVVVSLFLIPAGVAMAGGAVLVWREVFRDRRGGPKV